jgi:hypothetical protein
MTRAELESIIEEELTLELQNTQKKPSKQHLLKLVAALDKESVNTQEEVSDVPAIAEEFTSAGSVMNKNDRKMTPAQVKQRREIGKKILDAIHTPKNKRTPAQKSLRKALQASRDSKGPQPGNPYWEEATPKDKLNSFAWALASDYVLAGNGGNFDIEKRVDKDWRKSQRDRGQGQKGPEKQPEPEKTPKEPEKKGPIGGPRKPPRKPEKEPEKKGPQGPTKPPRKPEKKPEPPTKSPETPKRKKAQERPPKGTPKTARPKIGAAKRPKSTTKTTPAKSAIGRRDGLTTTQREKYKKILAAKRSGKINSKQAKELMNQELEKLSGIKRSSNQYTGLSPADRFKLAAYTNTLKDKNLSPEDRERLTQAKAKIQKRAATARGRTKLKEYASFIMNKLNTSLLTEQYNREAVFMAHLLHEINTVLGESA